MKSNFRNQIEWFSERSESKALNDATPEGSTAASENFAGPSDFTTTNNQVAGVEEGDL